jgi:hypothetical protein
VSWYDSAVEPKKGPRVTFQEPNTGKYRHVLLVYPYMEASGKPTCEIVGRPQGDGLVHASEAYRLARNRVQGAVSYGVTR